MKHFRLIATICFAIFALMANAQEDFVLEDIPADGPVRSTFGSSLIIDNETVVVDSKGTFLMNIQHRFGVFSSDVGELYGLYAPANIRLGFKYSLLDNLAIGFGMAKTYSVLDFNVKYAFLRQTESGSMPISVAYFGKMGIELGATPRYDVNGTDRLSYFHQIIIARKFGNKFSAQVSPSISHFNAIDKSMENDHIAIAFAGRYKVSATTSIIVNYDQPITQHQLNNPNPNIGFGVELTTSSHAFQIYIANYYDITHQYNNMFNMNNPLGAYTDTNGGEHKGGQFLLGFNITRLWNW
ncbi:MAG: hypothetical protein DRI69_12070 [Bacteroidetes bacterium]|nr:MAG: hypothetical protein DRI69_12070 [Bacteroidota bacterium]